MPDLEFEYHRKQSPVTGLFTFRPLFVARLFCVGEPILPAVQIQMRADTGASMASIPMNLATDVLALPPDFKAEQIAERVERESQNQSFSRTAIRSLSGSSHRAFPLKVLVEIQDLHGQIAKFEALIAFTEGQYHGSCLAGLTGFLDKFDLHFETRQFRFVPRLGYGVTFPK